MNGKIQRLPFWCCPALAVFLPQRSLWGMVAGSKGEIMKVWLSLGVFCLLLAVVCGGTARAATTYYENPEGTLVEFTNPASPGAFNGTINFTNRGELFALGNGRDNSNNPLSGLHLTGAKSELTNFGLITAIGAPEPSNIFNDGGDGISFTAASTSFLNFGVINATADGPNRGISFENTDVVFTNGRGGLINASNYSKGKGIFFEDSVLDLTNEGTIKAYAGGGSNSSVGIYFKSTALMYSRILNKGVIETRGEDDAIGMHFLADKFAIENQGTIRATGIQGIGISIENTDDHFFFHNSGEVIARGVKTFGYGEGFGIKLQTNAPMSLVYTNTGTTTAIGEGGTGGREFF